MNGPFVFRNKAVTLAQLEGQLVHARVLPQMTVERTPWMDRRETMIAQILEQPWARSRPGEAVSAPLIVRSCAYGEDGLGESFAGRFTTILDVSGPAALGQAIDAVFDSYGASIQGQVLIQPMVEQAVASGVVTSREVGSGRPYIVVSLSHGPDTTAITGGRTNAAEVHYHYRSAVAAPPGRQGAVIRMLREVEACTHLADLDLEFAFVHGEDTPILLQARPLVGVPMVAAARDRHSGQLELAEHRIRAVLEPHPLASGRRSVLGCMTDWNPAEMIGVRPRPLALSLYRSLVTDKVWSSQRSAYGYRDLGDFPLLIEILGSPYIDIRASFESFVPAVLEDPAAGRLVDYYVDRLLAAPQLHDKAEFEIVLSCAAFDLEDRVAPLRAAGHTQSDIDNLKLALEHLTRRVLDPVASPRQGDLAALRQLQARHQAILQADMPPLSAAYWLLEDCRRFGSRPFAGLARAGFIAMEMLNSLVAVGAIGADDRGAFLTGLSTVASRLQADFHDLPRAAFLGRYGHLRPGAYDILSPRYDEAPEAYFGQGAAAPSPVQRTAGAAAHPSVRDRLIQAASPLMRGRFADLTGERLVDFIEDGLREREEAKFLFTRNLSDVLSRLKQWGVLHEVTPEELSYADARVIAQGYGSARNPLELFSDSIREGREAYVVTAATCLPPVITDADQVWSFAVPPATPNFITSRSVQAPVASGLDPAQLPGAIVMIPSADPGFDWIFTHGIAGLVTAYGGANSHMAIRAAELDLPAVIGAGEHLFGDWSRARVLRIDCANRRVDPLPI